MAVIFLQFLVSSQVRPSWILLHGILLMYVMFIQIYNYVKTKNMWMNTKIAQLSYLRK